MQIYNCVKNILTNLKMKIEQIDRATVSGYSSGLLQHYYCETLSG